MKHPAPVGAAVVLVVVAIFVAVNFVTVTRHFEMHGVTVSDARSSCCGGNITPVEGIPLSFHGPALEYTAFGVGSCHSGKLACESNGTNGSGRLVADGEVYMFGSIRNSVRVPANVTGNYTSYLLRL